MATAYYGTVISPNQTETVEGYLICRNVPISRTGDQEYLARELGIEGDPERVVTVHRYAEDVFSKEALASFEGKPVTSPHPPENVGPENFSAYAKGHVQNVRSNGENVIADLYINDPTLASEVRNGVMREVSCGYMCNYEEDGDGLKQTNIRGNHVAVVPRGRAGHDVAIKDAANEAEKGRKGMANLLKGILSAFGMAAKDAGPEELETLADATAETIKALPDENKDEAPVEEPAADEVVYKEQKGTDLGSKVDQLLAKVNELEKKLSKEDTKDEKDLDEMIEKMEGDPEAAVTIEAEDKTGECGNDSALELLKRIRPAVAKIEDKQVRSTVVDALLATFKDSTTEKIVKAAQDNAVKNSQAKDSEESRRVAQQAAYDSRNPHKAKED